MTAEKKDPRRHLVSISPAEFKAIIAGDQRALYVPAEKKAKVGDELVLREWDEGYSGRQANVLVRHVAPHDDSGFIISFDDE